MTQSIAEREDLKREPSIFSRESRRLRVLRFASESADTARGEFELKDDPARVAVGGGAL